MPIRSQQLGSGAADVAAAAVDDVFHSNKSSVNE